MKNDVKKNNNSTLSLEAQLEELKKALAQSQRQFQSLIKNIPGIVYLCYYDEHWTMHYIVKEIEKISGYPASDFINNNVRSYASIIHPDDVDLVEKTISDRTAENIPYEIEYRLIRKDGEIAWVYEKGQKVSNHDGRVWLTGIIFDITEKKQATIALDIAAQEWQVTFDAIPHAIFLLNRECQIMKCNHGAEKLLAIKKDNIIGQRYCEIIDGIEEPYEDGPYMQMLKSGHKESVIRSLDQKTVEFTISPILDPEGEIYGSVLLIIDINSFKEAQGTL